MTGGLSLAELIQLLGAQGGGDLGAANTAGLLQSLGAGGLGAPSFGQPQGGQQGIAGQMSSPGAGGVIAGQNASIDPLSIIAKAFGILKTGVGLASPTNAAGTLGTEAGLSGITPEQQQAFQQQRTGERQDFTSSLPTGFLEQAVAAGATPADFQALGLSGPEIEKAFATDPAPHLGRRSRLER